MGLRTIRRVNEINYKKFNSYLNYSISMKEGNKINDNKDRGTSSSIVNTNSRVPHVFPCVCSNHFPCTLCPFLSVYVSFSYLGP
jgi:hypothetical protein